MTKKAVSKPSGTTRRTVTSRAGRRKGRGSEAPPRGGVYRRLLVPLDGSKESFAALRSALRLGRTLQATVVGYHALAPVPVPYFDAPPPGYPTPKEYRALMRTLARRYFEKAERLAHTAGVPFESMADARGEVAEGISEAARRMECDLIVLGSHGRGAFGRLLLGSVATRLISMAEVPVLVLPEQAIRRGRTSKPAG